MSSFKLCVSLYSVLVSEVGEARSGAPGTAVRGCSKITSEDIAGYRILIEVIVRGDILLLATFQDLHFYHALPLWCPDRLVKKERKNHCYSTQSTTTKASSKQSLNLPPQMKPRTACVGWSRPPIGVGSN